jgi:hypothetical protein
MRAVVVRAVDHATAVQLLDALPHSEQTEPVFDTAALLRLRVKTDTIVVHGYFDAVAAATYRHGA